MSNEKSSHLRSASGANSDLTLLTATIVSAYVGKNPTGSAELPGLIQSVYRSLRDTADSAEAGDAPNETEPAISVRNSITPDHIVCLEDGKRLKSMKRHVRAQHGLSPAQYRQKWGLPADYPMVAANYSKRRSELARTTGLGKIGKHPNAGRFKAREDDEAGDVLGLLREAGND